LRESFSEDLGEVGRNIGTVTLGLDKMLNLATGASLKGAFAIAESEGVSLKKATQSFLELAKAAQTSGVGIDKFINAVMGGYQALRQYGVEVKDVEQTMTRLVKHYREMGLGDKAAGEYAARGVGVLAQGISGMGDTQAAILGMRMYPGLNAHEAKQKVREGWMEMTDKGEGADVNMANKLVMAARSEIDEKMAGASRAEKIYGLQQFFGSNEAATHAFELTEAIKEGTATEEDSLNFMERLHDSFKTEAEAYSDLMKVQRDLINAMRKIGEGVLMMLSGLLGTIVVGFKSIPALIDALLSKGEERERKLNEIQTMVNTQTSNLGDGVLRGLDGMKEMGGVLGNTALKMSKDLEKVFDWEVTPSTKLEDKLGGALGASPFNNIEGKPLGLLGLGLGLWGGKEEERGVNPEDATYEGASGERRAAKERARQEAEDADRMEFTKNSNLTGIIVSSFVRAEDFFPAFTKFSERTAKK